MDAMLGLLDLDLFNVPSRDSETTAVTVHVVQVMKSMPTCGGCA